MKEEVFNAYVDKILELFKLSREELFSNNKRRDLVDARYLLYYLCSTRPMRIRYIKEYMVENGFPAKHSNIIHGINEIKKKMGEDNDYVHIVKNLEKWVM